MVIATVRKHKLDIIQQNLKVTRTCLTVKSHLNTAVIIRPMLVILEFTTPWPEHLHRHK